MQKILLRSLAGLVLIASTNVNATERTDVLAYHDNLALWVLGQTSSTTNVETGLIEFNAAYNPTTALLTGTTRFGKLQEQLSYYADGLVATKTDGKGNVTSFSDYKRGIPQVTRYPPTAESPTGATFKVGVSDDGLIRWIENELGARTDYSYDSMGRLTEIDYPDEANLVYLNTTLSLERVVTDKCGLPQAFYWLRTITTGNAKQVICYDALFQQVLTREYDVTNEAGTMRIQRFRYDTDGHVVFASYPSETDTAAVGTWSEYDALGRLTFVSNDSELGPLTTMTSYGSDSSGPYTIVTDPKQNQTRTYYMEFDSPTYQLPITLFHPQGAITNIWRDVFGKTQEMWRR